PVVRGLSARQILVERAGKKTTRSAIAVRVVFEGGHVTDNEVIDYMATIWDIRFLSMATFAFLSAAKDGMPVECVLASIRVLNAL
ncbi:MAG: hypothetical protein NTX94_00765, partial [Caldiserica bacterium]|nr:hypothetical protein [Caldisericota bacterium]